MGLRNLAVGVRITSVASQYNIVGEILDRFSSKVSLSKVFGSGMILAAIREAIGVQRNVKNPR